MKKPKNIKSISQQLGKMRSTYSNFKCKIVRQKLIVQGDLQPTARSRFYHFILEYGTNSSPEVRIVSPKLIRNLAGERIPHMYLQKHICLYQPKYKEFRRSEFLSDTVIPWISLWLYYYELWHLTGKWLGGGEHPK